MALLLSLLLCCLIGVPAYGGTYVVQPGDTLYAIARKFEVHPRELLALNPLEDPSLLSIGLELRIPKVEKMPAREPTEEDMELVAKVVWAEARGEDELGQLAVAAVIANRVKDPRFPDTVEEVIYQPGQFLVVEEGLLPDEVPERFVAIARRAFQGEDPTGGALFFYNPEKSRALDFWATRQTLTRIGNHNFAR